MTFLNYSLRFAPSHSSLLLQLSILWDSRVELIHTTSFYCLNSHSIKSTHFLHSIVSVQWVNSCRPLAHTFLNWLLFLFLFLLKFWRYVDIIVSKVLYIIFSDQFQSIREGKETFGMQKVVYPCRFFFLPIIPIQNIWYILVQNLIMLYVFIVSSNSSIHCFFYYWFIL